MQHSRNIATGFLTTILCFVLSSYNLWAQTLPENKVAEVEKYKTQIAQFQSQNNKNQTANYLTKVASIYWDAGMSNEAISYYKQSLDAFIAINNKNGVRTICNYLGLNYSDIQKWDDAKKYFEDALKINRELKDKEGIISALLNIAMVLQNKNSHAEAIKYGEEALTGAQELNNLKLIRKCYGILAECYERISNIDKSRKYFELYSLFDKKLKDEEVKDVKLKSEIAVATAYAEKRAKQFELDLQTFKLKEASDSLSEVEKISKERQMEIDLLNKDKKLRDLEIKEKEAQIEKERTFRITLIIVFLIVFISGILVLKQFIEKKKANKLLALQNIELQEKGTYIEHQNMLLEGKNAELFDMNQKIAVQNKLLENKNQHITESLQYASRIQRAILPSFMAIKSHFPESFVYYLPKEIVSGDFYWFSKQNNKVFLAAVDCTGHSVPGAFMSMIGNTLLNEIINEKKIYDPAVVLQRLNEGVIYNLRQSTTEYQDDGMDITLCCFDYDEMKIKLSSANHTVYVFYDSILQEVEGDIFSIGENVFSSRHEGGFTNHEFDMKKGTTLYFFSDGYQSQFGGPKKSKFLVKQFKEILEKCQPLEMEQQYHYLYKSFEDWKGENKQTDDVLVIGVKIS